MTSLPDWNDALRTLLAPGGNLGAGAAFGAAVLVGLIHALLPGHGKTLLAAHRLRTATEQGTGSALAGALIDGLILAAARVTAAVILAAVGLDLARGAGVSLSPEGVQMAAGLLLIGVGVVTAAHRERHTVTGGHNLR